MSRPSATITVPEVLGRFLDYLDKHPSWGSLHVVLDDNNIQDSCVQFCIGYSEKNGDREGAELARILLKMSKSQRLKIGRSVRRGPNANAD